MVVAAGVGELPPQLREVDGESRRGDALGAAEVRVGETAQLVRRRAAGVDAVARRRRRVVVQDDGRHEAEPQLVARRVDGRVVEQLPQRVCARERGAASLRARLRHRGRLGH